MTRGIKNNNPLNIRRSSTHWQGARKEQTDKSFVQFETMAYGYRAAWKILQTYYERFCMQNKDYTVRNIITRWAPPTENDTEAYIMNVLKMSGIGGKEKLLPPSNVLSYGRLSRMVSAMTCIECGIPYREVDAKPYPKAINWLFLLIGRSWINGYWMRMNIGIGKFYCFQKRNPQPATFF